MNREDDPLGRVSAAPFRHRTAQAAVTELLREAILSGEIRPGTRLRQTDVARRFSTSTTPVREALRQLTAEGLLDADAHRGVTVHAPNLSELEQIYEIRICVEQLSVAAAIEAMTDERLQRAEQVMSQMEEEPELARWTRMNAEFHHILTDPNRTRLAGIVDNLRNVSAIYIAASIQGPGEREAAEKEHRALYEAIHAGDSERAQDAVRGHLEHTLEICRRVLGEAAERPAED